MDALSRIWLTLQRAPRGRWLALALETAWYLFVLWCIWRCWDAPRRVFPYMGI